MQDSEVIQLAHAIAKANGHPHPLEWAQGVLSHWKEALGFDVQAVENKIEAVVQHVETDVQAVFEPAVAADQGEPNGQ